METDRVRRNPLLATLAAGHRQDQPTKRAKSRPILPRTTARPQKNEDSHHHAQLRRFGQVFATLLRRIEISPEFCP